MTIDMVSLSLESANQTGPLWSNFAESDTKKQN